MKRTAKEKPTYKYERLQAEIHSQQHSLPVVRWVMLGIIVLAGALCYVRMQARTETHRQAVNKLTAEYDTQSKALENERLRQESLTSGRQIRAAVQRMGLNLGKPQTTGQVRRMTLADSPRRGKSEGTKLVVAAD